VKTRGGTPSESSVSGLEDAERRKRVKRPRVKVTYQPSEEDGTEDGPPVHSSGSEDSSGANDRQKEVEDEYKSVSRSTMERTATQPLESSRQVNAERGISCQPLTKRVHPRSSSKVSSQSRSARSLEIWPVLGFKKYSTSRQVIHPSALSSDDDLNLFACSSP